MEQAYIHLPEAVVTLVCEFRSKLGYGVRFNVEASSGNGIIYFELVTYDNEARSYCKYIHEGDSVEATGTLKAKPYRKKDGTTGLSLVIERPESIKKVTSSNRNPQLPQDSADNITTNPFQGKDAVTASAVSASEETVTAETASSERAFAITDELIDDTCNNNEDLYVSPVDAAKGLRKFMMNGVVYESWEQPIDPNFESEELPL